MVPANMMSAEMALYVGLVLIGLWVVYRVYVSYVIKPEGFTGTGNHKLVLYYADWCGHCKVCKPEFQKLGAKQTIGARQVDIAMVNAEKDAEAMKGVQVRGYPTIILYDPKGQVVEEYQGERTEEAFHSFLEQNVA